MNSPEIPAFEPIRPETFGRLQNIISDYIIYNTVHGHSHRPETAALTFDSDELTVDLNTGTSAWVGSGQLADELTQSDIVVWRKSELFEDETWLVGHESVTPVACIDIMGVDISKTDWYVSKILIATADERVFEINDGGESDDSSAVTRELGEQEVQAEIQSLEAFLIEISNRPQ